MNRKLITPFDVCLIVLALLIGFAVMSYYLFYDEGNVAVVTVDDKVIAEIELNLDKSERIETTAGYNVVVVKNGECRVSKADCRDGICVKHSAINKVGQSIVCLPHKLIVEIK